MRERNARILDITFLCHKLMYNVYYTIYRYIHMSDGNKVEVRYKYLVRYVFFAVFIETILLEIKINYVQKLYRFANNGSPLCCGLCMNYDYIIMLCN